MTGANSTRPVAGAWKKSATALIGLSLGIAVASGSAVADKVGVAAAVNPDAFSSLAGKPQSQLNIGKSIFYNERINTTASGLVQVLLVDGSTFTVGPGSDLVIDKFVYDPKKGTGQIAASMSKGVMRFVGGKISKNENAVKVDTPAGALAIRGGMFQMKVNGSKLVASFLYGVALTLGNKYTVYEPGYTIDTTSGVPTVRPTTSADIATIMAALTNGNTGGINGNQPDPPQQPSSTLVDTTSLSQLISDATATQIQSEVQNQLNNQPPSQPIPPETVDLPTDLEMRVLTAPDFYVANQRSFWSPGIFIADPGGAGILGGDDAFIPCFLAPTVCGSSYGFFKVTSDDFDASSTSIANGRIQGDIPALIRRTGLWSFEKLPSGTFDFPIFNVVGVHQVTNAVVIDEDGTTTLVGSAFTGRGGGFFAYQLFPLEDIQGVMTPNLNQPILAFGGTPFEKPAGESNQVRLFNLFTDPRQNISIPFAAKATAPTNLAGATIQPLYLLEGGEDGRSVWLQTSFLIQDHGPNQETILVLALGEQTDDGQLVGFRRGMSYIPTVFFDHDDNSGTAPVPFKQPINFGGNIATLAGPDGETHLFGSTLPHFVIGADSTGNGHNIFQDEPLYPQAFPPPPNQNFGQTTNYVPPPPLPSNFLGATYHIGEQVAQTNVPAPVTTDADVDFYGYASGIYQQTTTNLESDEPPVGMLLNSDPTNVHLKFKADNRLSALFNLHGEDGVDDGGASLAFGDWGNAHGRSAVINGNIYAAVESATQESTVKVDGFYPWQQVTRTADASLYLVSGNLLNPNAQPCTNCDFIKWGTWGGQVKFKDGFGFWQQDVTADVNLGWYVTGNISRLNQLAGLTGSAEYNGSAIGNVAALNQATGLWDTYVATGDLHMDWNFGTRSGNLNINNFDAQGAYGPLNVSGAMSVPGQLDPVTNPTSTALNQFNGALTGTLGTGDSPLAATGFATGSFVGAGTGADADPRAGVIGNWKATSGDVYGVTGVFAGRR